MSAVIRCNGYAVAELLSHEKWPEKVAVSKADLDILGKNGCHQVSVDGKLFRLLFNEDFRP